MHIYGSVNFTPLRIFADRRACDKYYISVCMMISQLVVNFILDHATKYRHFIVSNILERLTLFLEYGELPALIPILQITCKLKREKCALEKKC